MAHWSEPIIDALHPCHEAADWMRKQKTKTAAWKSCKRGDWMLWLLGRVGQTEADRKKLVLAACDCAATALKYVPKGEDRPRLAIEAARKWARGEAGATLEQVRQAYAASASAYAAASASASASAYAAAYASAAADAAAARARALARSAGIVRRHYPRPPVWRKGN